MATRQRHGRTLRILIAAITAATLGAVLLAHPGHSRGAATATTQASVNVAVIPGFAPPAYPGTSGVPRFPVGAAQLSAYHFSQVAVNQVTASALSSYDTVILYGIRWSDISASGQAAINAFAATHKVVIWDADDTGSQNYSTFIHPFSDTSSGENFAGKQNDSVVSFPTGTDFLASDNPGSPYYLDPNQLVSDRDELNDMSVMTTGTQNWLPALSAANAKIPKGGWPLAWSYGVIGDHTGMTIYSGIDADALGNSQLSPNYALKGLALQLQAQFRETPDPSCAHNCTLGGASGSGPPHASCSFAKNVPTGWVHGRVPITVKTSEAAGITGRALSPKALVLASGKESGGLVHLRVKTRLLPTNRVSHLRAVVYVNGQEACSKPFKLKVDNTPPRLLSLRLTTAGSLHLASFEVSEKSRMWITGARTRYSHSVLIAAHRLITVRLPGRVRHANLVLQDRAGNRVIRKLRW